MSWLLREGDVLAAVEPRRLGWAAGLQGGELHGVVVVSGLSIVHTLGCSASFDLAWCTHQVSDAGEVAGVGKGGGRCLVRVSRMVRLDARRVARPRLGRGAMVVAPTGSFDRWHLHLGDQLEITS